MAERQLAEDSLPVLFQTAVDAHGRLPSLDARSPEFKKCRDEAIEKFRMIQSLLDSLTVFSPNEDYKEHSTASLRFVLTCAYLGDLISRTNFPDDPLRDTKRVTVLQESIATLREFLQLCVNLKFPFAPEEKLDQHLHGEFGINAVRSRDELIAQKQLARETEKRIEELGKLLAAKPVEEGVDDDLLREHHIAFIHCWVLRACDNIVMLFRELSMLKERAKQPEAAEGAAAAAAGAPPRKPSGPPLVLTKEMVEQMVREQSSLTRANFKLITRGFGPIGAPTMSIEEALHSGSACCSLKDCVHKKAKPVKTDSGDEEEEEDEETKEKVKEEEDMAAADAATMRAREFDEYKDHVRRGDGNRYNMG